VENCLDRTIFIHSLITSATGHTQHPQHCTALHSTAQIALADGMPAGICMLGNTEAQGSRRKPKTADEINMGVKNFIVILVLLITALAPCHC
jgi:hypothetical protein